MKLFHGTQNIIFSMFDLKDRVIVLTGSTGVLASSLATSLAKAKAKLFILGRNKNLLLELKKSIERYTVVEYYVADVLKRSELEAVCASIVKKTGRIDVLINAVGNTTHGVVSYINHSLALVQIAPDVVGGVYGHQVDDLVVGDIIEVGIESVESPKEIQLQIVEEMKKK